MTMTNNTVTFSYYIVHNYGQRILVELKFVRVFSFCEILCHIDTGFYGVMGNSQSFKTAEELEPVLRSVLLEGFANLYLQAKHKIYTYGSTPPTVPIPQVEIIITQFINGLKEIRKNNQPSRGRAQLKSGAAKAIAENSYNTV